MNRSKRRPFAFAFVLAPVLLVQCAETSGHKAVDAASLGVVAAGAAVVNRAITKDCYAYVCAYGTECDHESGMCVPLRERDGGPRDAGTLSKPGEPAEPPMCSVPDASILLRQPCDAGANR